MIPEDHFIRELIEDEDIIFNKDSDYHKQRKKEKKNPIFKRNNLKRKAKKMKDTLIRFLLAWSLIATCLLFMQREAQKPLLVYHADSKYQIMGMR